MFVKQNLGGRAHLSADDVPALGEEALLLDRVATLHCLAWLSGDGSLAHLCGVGSGTGHRRACPRADSEHEEPRSQEQSPRSTL